MKLCGRELQLVSRLDGRFGSCVTSIVVSTGDKQLYER